MGGGGSHFRGDLDPGGREEQKRVRRSRPCGQTRCKPERIGPVWTGLAIRVAPANESGLPGMSRGKEPLAAEAPAATSSHATGRLLTRKASHALGIRATFLPCRVMHHAWCITTYCRIGLFAPQRRSAVERAMHRQVDEFARSATLRPARSGKNDSIGSPLAGIVM